MDSRASHRAARLFFGLALGALAGDATDLGSLILDPGVPLNGRVVDPGGAPVAGAQLQARAAQGAMFSQPQGEVTANVGRRWECAVTLAAGADEVLFD